MRERGFITRSAIGAVLLGAMLLLASIPGGTTEVDDGRRTERIPALAAATDEAAAAGDGAAGDGARAADVLDIADATDVLGAADGGLLYSEWLTEISAEDAPAFLGVSEEEAEITGDGGGIKNGGIDQTATGGDSALDSASATPLAGLSAGSFVIRRGAGERALREVGRRWRGVFSDALQTSAFDDARARRMVLDYANGAGNFRGGDWRTQWTGIPLRLSDIALDEALFLTESLGGRLSFIRTLDLDFQSALGERPWQFGINILGAFRESDEEAIAWQLRGFGGQDERIGGNAGLIYRRDMHGDLFGANAFLDYEDNEYGDFWRWSLGAEVRAAWLDFFANRYWAITDTQTSGDFVAYSQDGYDVAFKFHAPGARWISGGVAWYLFEGRDLTDEDRARGDDEGLRYGVELGPFGDGSFLGGVRLEIEYDKPFDGDDDFGGRLIYTRVFGKAAAGNVGGDAFSPKNYFFAPVRREYAQRIRAVRTATRQFAEGGERFFFESDGGGVTVFYNRMVTVVVRDNADEQPEFPRFEFSQTVSLSTDDSARVRFTESGRRWLVSLAVRTQVGFSAGGDSLELRRGTVFIDRNDGLDELKTGQVTVDLRGTELLVGTNGARTTINLSEGRIEYNFLRDGDLDVVVADSGGTDRPLVRATDGDGTVFNVGCVELENRYPLSARATVGAFSQCLESGQVTLQKIGGRAELRSIAGGRDGRVITLTTAGDDFVEQKRNGLAVRWATGEYVIPINARLAAVGGSVVIARGTLTMTVADGQEMVVRAAGGEGLSGAVELSAVGGFSVAVDIQPDSAFTPQVIDINGGSGQYVFQVVSVVGFGDFGNRLRAVGVDLLSQFPPALQSGQVGLRAGSVGSFNDELELRVAGRYLFCRTGRDENLCGTIGTILLRISDGNSDLTFVSAQTLTLAINLNESVTFGQNPVLRVFAVGEDVGADVYTVQAVGGRPNEDGEYQYRALRVIPAAAGNDFDNSTSSTGESFVLTRTQTSFSAVATVSVIVRATDFRQDADGNDDFESATLTVILIAADALSSPQVSASPFIDGAIEIVAGRAEIAVTGGTGRYDFVLRAPDSLDVNNHFSINGGDVGGRRDFNDIVGLTVNLNRAYGAADLDNDGDLEFIISDADDDFAAAVGMLTVTVSVGIRDRVRFRTTSQTVYVLGGTTSPILTVAAVGGMPFGENYDYSNLSVDGDAQLSDFAFGSGSNRRADFFIRAQTSSTVFDTAKTVTLVIQARDSVPESAATTVVIIVAVGNLAVNSPPLEVRYTAAEDLRFSFTPSGGTPGRLSGYNFRFLAGGDARHLRLTAGSNVAELVVGAGIFDMPRVVRITMRVTDFASPPASVDRVLELTLRLPFDFTQESFPHRFVDGEFISDAVDLRGRRNAILAAAAGSAMLTLAVNDDTVGATFEVVGVRGRTTGDANTARSQVFPIVDNYLGYRGDRVNSHYSRRGLDVFVMTLAARSDADDRAVTVVILVDVGEVLPLRFLQAAQTLTATVGDSYTPREVLTDRTRSEFIPIVTLVFPSAYRDPQQDGTFVLRTFNTTVTLGNHISVPIAGQTRHSVFVVPQAVLAIYGLSDIDGRYTYSCESENAGAFADCDGTDVVSRGFLTVLAEETVFESAQTVTAIITASDFSDPQQTATATLVVAVVVPPEVVVPPDEPDPGDSRPPEPLVFPSLQRVVIYSTPSGGRPHRLAGKNLLTLAAGHLVTVKLIPDGASGGTSVTVSPARFLVLTASGGTAFEGGGYRYSCISVKDTHHNFAYDLDRFDNCANSQTPKLSLEITPNGLFAPDTRDNLSNFGIQPHFRQQFNFEFRFRVEDAAGNFAHAIFEVFVLHPNRAPPPQPAPLTFAPAPRNVTVGLDEIFSIGEPTAERNAGNGFRVQDAGAWLTVVASGSADVGYFVRTPVGVDAGRVFVEKGETNIGTGPNRVGVEDGPLVYGLDSSSFDDRRVAYLGWTGFADGAPSPLAVTILALDADTRTGTLVVTLHFDIGATGEALTFPVSIPRDVTVRVDEFFSANALTVRNGVTRTDASAWLTVSVEGGVTGVDYFVERTTPPLGFGEGAVFVINGVRRVPTLDDHDLGYMGWRPGFTPTDAPPVLVVEILAVAGVRAGTLTVTLNLAEPPLGLTAPALYLTDGDSGLRVVSVDDGDYADPANPAQRLATLFASRQQGEVQYRVDGVSPPLPDGASETLAETFPLHADNDRVYLGSTASDVYPSGTNLFTVTVVASDERATDSDPDNDADGSAVLQIVLDYRPPPAFALPVQTVTLDSGNVRAPNGPPTSDTNSADDEDVVILTVNNVRAALTYQVRRAEIFPGTNPDNNDGSAVFTVNNNGQLRLDGGDFRMHDNDSSSQYRVLVRATDSGSGRVGTATVFVRFATPADAEVRIIGDSTKEINGRDVTTFTRATLDYSTNPNADAVGGVSVFRFRHQFVYGPTREEYIGAGPSHLGASDSPAVLAAAAAAFPLITLVRSQLDDPASRFPATNLRGHLYVIGFEPTQLAAFDNTQADEYRLTLRLADDGRQTAITIAFTITFPSSSSARADSPPPLSSPEAAEIPDNPTATGIPDNLAATRIPDNFAVIRIPDNPTVIRIPDNSAPWLFPPRTLVIPGYAGISPIINSPFLQRQESRSKN